MDHRYDFRRLQVGALAVGAVAVAAAILVALLGGGVFFESYLFAMLFWVGLSLGCLVLLLVVHLAGGSWGALILRPLEAGVGVLPLMALLFVPLLFVVGQLYVWTDPEYLATHPTVDFKTGYLNTPFFIIRTVIYFAAWIFIGFRYLRGTRRQDGDADAAGSIGYGLKREAGMWIVAFVGVTTFAFVDWGMSLTPVWWSGIYSVIFMISQAITAVAFIILAMGLLARRDRRVNELLTPKRLQDLGNFLMAFTMFWAYVSAAQLIILWSNNVVETNTWYVQRLGPGWVGVGVFLLFFGFFAPFLILFSRWVKRKRRALTLVAIWAIFVQLTNVYYFIIPTYERGGPQLTIVDVLLVIGIGGLWLAFYGRRLSGAPILPLNDPRLADPHPHQGHETIHESGANLGGQHA